MTLINERQTVSVALDRTGAAIIYLRARDISPETPEARMFTRRTLIACASRLAMALHPAITMGANMSGQREAIADPGAALGPEEAICAWLCAGRLALALDAKRKDVQ